MRIDVTFEQTDMEIRPAFDMIIPMDISSASVQALLDGTISGAYISDKVTSLRNYAFYGCSNLKEVSLPNCTGIRVYSFGYCTNIESIDLPMCTWFGGTNTFESATKLKTINVPNLTQIYNGNRTFVSCKSLEELNAPNLTALTNTERMFAECESIKKISLPQIGGTTISANTFYKCYLLETLILGGSEINPLANVNAFDRAGLDTENGLTIYVPDNLVDTYKTATNWTAFAGKIKPISELGE